MAFPTGWAHRVSITIDKDDIDADLTDWTLVFDQAFDSVLTQVNGPLDADGTRESIDGGGDVRFSSDEDGSTQLAVDIRDWSTDNTPGDATCEVAVKVPSVSSSADTTIYMWWGKSGETQPAVTDTYGQYNAYDSDYVLVQPDGSGENERTNNSRTWTKTGTFTAGGATGAVGKATDYTNTQGDVASEFYSAASTDMPIGSKRDHTVEMLTRYDLVTDTTIMFSERGRTPITNQVFFTTSAENAIVRDDANDNVNPSFAGAPSTGTWYYHGASFNEQATDSFLLRINGSTATATGTIDAITVDSDYRASFPSYWFLSGSEYRSGIDGLMCEIRISLTNRADAWLSANYHNQMNTSGFLTWGTISDVGGGTDYGVDLADSVGITDTDSQIRNIVEALADTVGATDSIAEIIGRVIILSESIGITDSIGEAIDRVIIISESIGITDVLSETVFQLVSVLLENNVGITDTIDRTSAFIKTLSNNVGITDTLNRIGTYYKTFSDSVGITDSLTGSLVLYSIIADTVGITDTLTAVTAGFILATIADSVGVTDSLDRVGNYIREFIDTVGITDDLEKTATLIKTISDNLGVSDLVTANLIIGIILTDNVGITDEVTGLAFISQVRELISGNSTINYLIEGDSVLKE